MPPADTPTTRTAPALPLPLSYAHTNLVCEIGIADLRSMHTNENVRLEISPVLLGVI